MERTLHTLYRFLGNVVLTHSSGPAMRQKALDRFGFDLAEVAERSRLTFEGYEEGKITLEEHLDLVVFYQKRSFSRKALTDFMLHQSQAHPEMLAFWPRHLKALWAEGRRDSDQ